MAHDSDVARVAAALKSPGIRYRNFGNGPVRGAVMPIGDAARSSPSSASAMNADTEMPAPHPAHGGATDTRPVAEFASFAPPEPDGSAAPEPPPVAAPAGDFPFGAPIRRPEPSFSLAPAPFPHAVAPGLCLAPAETRPTNQGTGSYRLLEALGLPGGAGHAPPPANQRPATMPKAPPRSTTGTMERLGRVTACGPRPPVQAGAEAPAADVARLPPVPGPLPAAMVTLPLAEVLRLIATGVSAAQSPFAALRLPGGTTNSR